MSQNRFDVIILGDSLASRIAAVLLAKGGYRVLSFEEDTAPSSSWFLSSLHLERLLEGLNGRGCFIPTTPFQVLTADSRIEFQPAAPLKEELRREFSSSHDQVAEFLDELHKLGGRLEETLLECGGLPLLGTSSRWRFTRRRIPRKLTRSTLVAALSNRISELRQESARKALNTLFAGLSLTPIGKLSMAEASLLWSSAVRPQSVGPTSLHELLEHRYLQFHGKIEKLSSLGEVLAEGHRLTGATLKRGGRYEGDFFLLGSPAAWKFLPESHRTGLKSCSQHLCFRTTSLNGMISPLLADRIIPGSSVPIRLCLEQSDRGTMGVVEVANDGTPAELLGQSVQETLKQVLPFASFQLECCFSDSAGPAANGSGACRFFPGATGRLKLRKNLFLCHGVGVLPSLGTTGDVIIGMTMANHFLRHIKRKK